MWGNKLSVLGSPVAKNGQTLMDASCKTETGSREGSLTLSIIHGLGLVILHLGSCPVLHRVFSQV